MAKKEKPKKEKKKKQKQEQPEGGKKGGKKKLLLLIPVLAAVGAGAYFFVLKGGGLPFLGGGGEKPLDVYAVEDEMVAALPAALETGGEETLISITTNVAPPEEGEAAAETEEDDEEKEELNRGEAQVITEEDSNGVLWTYYYYQIDENTVADLAAYAEFLKGEGFRMVGEGGADEETAALGKYQKDAETKKDFIFSIDLEYPLAGDAATGQFAVKARMEEKEEVIVENVPTMSRDEAVSYISGVDHTKLGLEYPVSDYNVTVDMGRTYIDGKDCYGINIYSKGNGPDGGNFVKKFYLSLGDQKIYEYLNNDIFDLQSVSSAYPEIERNSTLPASASMAGNGNEAATGQEAAGMQDWQFGTLE